MSNTLYLHGVALSEQPMLPRAQDMVKAYEADNLNALLDEWSATDRVLNLPRTMAMELCEKRIDPRRAKPMLAVFERLLGMGVSVNDTMKQRSLLCLAANAGNIAVVRFLLEHGANPNARSSMREQTPLHAAASMGEGGICELLIQHGADISLRDSYGNSPLACACLSENTLPAIQVLLAHGADATHRLKDGRTLLHVLVANGLSWKRKEGADFRQAVVELVSHGVEIDARDNNGEGLDKHMNYVGPDVRKKVQGAIDEGLVLHQAKQIEAVTVPAPTPRRKSRL